MVDIAVHDLDQASTSGGLDAGAPAAAGARADHRRRPGDLPARRRRLADADALARGAVDALRGAAAHRLRRDRAVARLHRAPSRAAALSPPRRSPGRATAGAQRRPARPLRPAAGGAAAAGADAAPDRPPRAARGARARASRSAGAAAATCRASPSTTCPPSCNRWASTSTGCSAGWSRRSTPSARWPPTPRTSCARRWRRCACGCRPRSTRTWRAPTCRRRSTRSPPSAIAPTSCCSFRAPNRRTRSRASRSTWCSSPPRWPRSSGARRRHGGGSTCEIAESGVAAGPRRRRLAGDRAAQPGRERAALRRRRPGRDRGRRAVRAGGARRRSGRARLDPRNPAPPPRPAHPGRRRLRPRPVDRRHHRRQARRPSRAQLAAARPAPGLRSADHPASGDAVDGRTPSGASRRERIPGAAARSGRSREKVGNAPIPRAFRPPILQ